MLTGSFDSLIGKLFSNNLTDEINKLVNQFKKMFGDNLYIEIQRHNDVGEKSFENYLLNISNKLEIPIIATHEVYYLEKEMHEAHDAYLCIGEKTYVNVKDRRKYTDQHYLKTAEEMNKLFHDLPDALANNVNFPMRVSFRPKNSLPILPNIKTSKIKDVDELLTNESLEGLKEKLKEYVLPFCSDKDKESSEKIYFQRLNHEISIISKMKYSSYFLIVSDYIKWAKKK